MPIDESGVHSCGYCEETENFRHMRQCSYCGKDQSEYFCFICKEPGCRKIECPEHVTCWERHLPDDAVMRRRHHPIDPMADVYVKAVTYSERDEDEQMKNHQRDRRNQWFLIYYEPDQQGHPEPWLSVTDRFSQLCDPHRAGNRLNATQYPSFVSFIGDTGVGKSTLLRSQLLMSQVNVSREASEDENETFQKLLKAKQQGPVSRSASTNALTDPTSSGVHLYKDIPNPHSQQDHACPESPILFADCEGFRGNIAKTNSERATDNGAPQYTVLNKRVTAPGIRSQQGKEGAEIFYARYLYAMSDCLVFVTKSDQMIHTDLQRLMEWAASAVYNTVNQAVHKTLIIVRNMPELHNPVFYNSNELDKSLFKKLKPLWEGSAILKDFKKRHDDMFQFDEQRIHTNKDLFDKFFKSHEACYIPSDSKAPVGEIYKQYESLRRKIDRACETSQEGRRRSWTQYNVPTLTHLLSRAFEHYRMTDRPFDFFTAARKDNPTIASPADHMANYLSRIWKNRNSDLTMFTAAVSVSLLNYVLRNFQGNPRDPREYFERVLKEFCRHSLTRFGDKYQRCGFRFDSVENVNCVVQRSVHVEHCNRDGTRRPGEFVDDMNPVRDSIMDAIWSKFAEVFQNVCASDRSALPSPKQACRQREDVLGAFAVRWKSIKSNRTCFACLYQTPDHFLHCGHSLCADCVVEFGIPSNRVESCWIVPRCPLCQTSWDHPPIFRLKPKCAGVRVLTLDGGGIRGIVELAILEQVMTRLVGVYGVDVPIRDLFDLVMGTSTGGIIALGLSLLTDMRVETMKQQFMELAKATFEAPRAGWLISRLDPFGWAPRTLMILRLKESIYRTRPLKEGLQNLFGQSRLLFSGGPGFREPRVTRVAVTSAKDEAATACLITNYNRPQTNPGSTPGGLGWRSDLQRWNSDYNQTDFEREDREEKEFKAWEAGLATAAAPFYFKPLSKPETDRDYVDGAVHANLPIETAVLEIARIWPELGSAPPDVLVSVGTGRQQSELRIPNVLDIGGLKRLCNVLHQNLDTGRLWHEFRQTNRRNTRLMERIHRLNVDITLPYVALDKWECMSDLATMVEEQMRGPESQLASLVAGAADVLAASLFFFEPASPATDGISPIEMRQAEPRPTFSLHGTIRCRLAKASPALKRLLDRVAWFAHKELAADGSPDTRTDGWAQIHVSDDVRALVSRHEEWLRVPVHVLVYEEEPAKQVLAMQIRGREDEEPIPISGFPMTLNDLRARAGIPRS